MELHYIVLFYMHVYAYIYIHMCMGLLVACVLIYVIVY